jgi:integrase
VGQLQGTIFKKCDMAGHKPNSNKGCAAGTCQHTCADIVRCPHKWTLRYSANGKQSEKSFADKINPNTGRVDYGSGQKLARDFQLKLTHDKRAHGAAFTDPKLSDGNFGEAVLAFIASGRRTSERTKEGYYVEYGSLIRPRFGDLKVSQVANMRAEVDALLNVALIDASMGTRRLVRRLIAGTLDAAVDAGKLARHYCGRIELAVPEVCEDDEEEESRGFVFITDEQVRMLADGIVRGGKFNLSGVGIAVWLQRTMGLRICEALGVEKSDFVTDAEGNVFLRLRWQASRDGSKRVPLKKRKARQGRTVPVPAFTWAMVRDLPDGPLCPGQSTPYQPYKPVQAKFKRLTAAMGVEGFTTHSLRHQFASESLADGMNIVDLSEILGHADVSVTLKTYVHATPDSAIRTRAMMDKRWGQAGNQE